MEEPKRRPTEVSQSLGVSSSTLRRWSTQFSDYLSPEAGSRKGTGHRRYVEDDVVVLEQVQQLMQEGYSAEEVRVQLTQPIAEEADGETVEAEAEDKLVDWEEWRELALQTTDEVDGEAPDIADLIAKTLASLSDSQQMILSGQNTARQLLGVLLQDNFNLKEENTRLRERMLENERNIYELKREMNQERNSERERMRQMEAYLFDLQRRLDALAEQRAGVQPAPGPVVGALPQPATAQIAPTSVSVSEQPVPGTSAPPENATVPDQTVQASGDGGQVQQQPAPQKKRGFFNWLFGS